MPKTNKKIVLVIADGWGIGQNNNSNPIYQAKTPNISFIKENFLTGALQASGLAVGLPWNEEGNSEIGHLTIGAGRIIYQSAARINSALTDNSFYENTVFSYIIQKAIENNGSVNLVGLLGTGITHSAFNHLQALIKLIKSKGASYKLHLFTDGRDSSVKSAISLLNELDIDRLGSLSGRFYGMDRDSNLDRTNKSLKAILGEASLQTIDPKTYLQLNYDKNITDENIPPASFGNKSLALSNNDSLIFFNFRADRMRQISKAIYNQFPQMPMASFTKYEESSPILYAFDLEKIKNTLPEVLANNNLSQLHIAESEKYAHITYFLNGEDEKMNNQEFRIIIPSNKITNHDKYPEMMAKEITSRVVSAVEENLYDVIIVNYANADMVAHTGNFEATIKAIETIDESIGKIKEAVLQTNSILIFTSDHGNAERLVDPLTGEKDTRHNSSPVPFYLVSDNHRRPKSKLEALENEKIITGSLCDIAPTILELLGINKPNEMTGESLLNSLN